MRREKHPNPAGSVIEAASADASASDLERALPVRGEELRTLGGELASATGSPRWQRSLNRVLTIQHPVVESHVRLLRRRHPQHSPAQILRTLEREYLAAVTTGGAAVGASAVIPGVGIGISLALSGAETAYFLEATALYAQSVTEVHGVALTDPERARTIVMAMMLGGPGADLVTQLAGEAIGTGPARQAFWGELVAQRLPKSAVSGVSGLVRKRFVGRFVRTQSASVIGRAIPFGIGAVIGGIGNHALGRKVVTSSRTAFGPAPASFASELPAPAPRRG